MDPHANHVMPESQDKSMQPVLSSHVNHGVMADSSTQHGSGAHSMKMYFNTDAPFHLLFEPWFIDTSGKVIGAFIGVFILTIIYEALTALREKLLLKAACRDRCPPLNEDSNTTPLAGTSCPSCPIPVNDHVKVLSDPNNAGENSQLRLLSNLRFRRFDRFFDGLHVVQTLLHLIQMFIGYMLMLIVMTYNVYMLIAIMAGFTCGHFVFARQRPLLLRSPTCCH